MLRSPAHTPGVNGGCASNACNAAVSDTGGKAGSDEEMTPRAASRSKATHMRGYCVMAVLYVVTASSLRPAL